MDHAKEVRQRLQDRLSRPECAQLHPREHERLMGLLRRSDALGTASWLIRNYADEPNTNKGALDEEVAAVEAASKEANEQFHLYRQEVGLSE